MVATGPGFVLDSDLAIATGGDFQLLDTTPPTAVPAVRPLSPLDRRFGVDLYFPGDLVVGADSDFQLVRGLEGWRAAFLRSLVTRPGEIHWHPQFGVGLQDFLNLPFSTANVIEIKRRITASVAQNQEIEQLVALDVVSPRDAVSRVDIRMTVVVAGQQRPIAVAIRST